MNFITLLFALFSIVSQPITPPADFVSGIDNSRSIFMPGTFIGREWKCREEMCYAGIIWIDGQATPQTGP